MLLSSSIAWINMDITMIVWQVHILASTYFSSHRGSFWLELRKLQVRVLCASAYNTYVNFNWTAIAWPLPWPTDYDTTSSSCSPSCLAPHLNRRLGSRNLLGSSENQWINITVHSNLINFGISNIGELTMSSIHLYRQDYCPKTITASMNLTFVKW